MAIADNMPNDRPQDQSRRITALEAAVRELRAARNLDRATITPDAGLGIRTGDFDGTNFANPGTTGNYFGGDGAVLNSLYLRPGSLGNDVLANPLVIGQGNNGLTNFAVTTTESTIVSINFTVPDGFSGFYCIAMGGVTVVNGTAVADFILDRVWVGSSYGDTLYAKVQPGDPGGRTVFKQGQLNGLTAGDTITVSLKAWTSGSTWPANTSSIATLNALAFWLR